MAKPRRPAKKTHAKPKKRPVRARKPAAKAPRRAPAPKPRKVPARFKAMGGVDPRDLPPGTPYPCRDGYINAVVRGEKLAGRIVACATPPAGKRGQHFVLGKVASGRAISAEFRKGYRDADKATKRERARRDSIRTPIDVYETPWQPSRPTPAQRTTPAGPAFTPRAPAPMGVWFPPTLDDIRDPRRYMNEVATFAASVSAALDAAQRPGKWRTDYTPRLSSGREFVTVRIGDGIRFRVDKDGSIDYLAGSRQVPIPTATLFDWQSPRYPQGLPTPIPVVVSTTTEKAPGVVNAATRPVRPAAGPEDRRVRAYVPTWAPSTVGSWKGVKALPMPKFKKGDYKGVGEVSKLVRAEVLKQVKARNLPDIEVATTTDRYSMGQSISVRIVSVRGLSESAFALRTDWRDGERVDELSAEGRAVLDSVKAIADQWNDRRSYYEPGGDFIDNDTYHLNVKYDDDLRRTEVAVLSNAPTLVDFVLSVSIETILRDAIKKAGGRGVRDVRVIMPRGPGAGYVVEVKTRKDALQAEAMDPTDARNVAFALARELGESV